MSYETLGKGVVKRKSRRVLGLFIDGTGLDRATRRLNRKVDMPRLVRGVTSGITPAVARYYTLIPYEDDSRHRAFLDAVRRAGLRVIVKRLPPKGITRQVSVDVEMAADMVAFAMGKLNFSDLNEYLPADSEESSGPSRKTIPLSPGRTLVSSIQPTAETSASEPEPAVEPEPVVTETEPVQRIVTVVCPSRDLAHPIALAGESGADTVTADFGQFNAKDVLKSAAKWIDLSDSETIWRE